MRTIVLFGLLSLIGCSSGDDAKKPSSASQDGGPGGAAGSSAGGASNGGSSSGGKGGAVSGGSGGSITDVPCGDAICKPLSDPSVESNACCTAETKCGLRLPFAQACLSINQPGTVNPVCPGYEVQGKVQYPGCCSPQGCGARVTTGGIGCVANETLGLAHKDCVFDTNPDGG